MIASYKKWVFRCRQNSLQTAWQFLSFDQVSFSAKDLQVEKTAQSSYTALIQRPNNFFMLGIDKLS